MVKKLIAAFFIPLFVVTFLYAGNGKKSIKPLKIVFFDIRDNYTQGSSSNKLRTGLSMVLNTILLGNKYVKSVLQKKGRKSSCFNSSCAGERGKILKADKVVTGEIKSLNKSSYLLLLTITDVKTGNVDLTIKEKSSIPGIEKAVDRALEKIKNFFKNVKRGGDKPPPPNRTPIPSRKISINILGSRIFTYGAFRSMSTSGYGLKIKPEIKDIFFSKSVFQFSASWYSFRNENDNFNSFSSTELGLLAGYSLGIKRQWDITPLLGAGYNIHIVNENGDRKIYSDPQITAGLDISYIFFNDLKFVFSPSYTFFLEKDNTGRYLGINAGLGLNF